MKLAPFKYYTLGHVAQAENEQFSFRRVEDKCVFIFKGKNVSIRPVKALIKEIERLSVLK